MSSRNVLHAIGLIVATPMLALAQAGAVHPGVTGPAWSPYLVGVLIGVLSMFTCYFSAKPLGASTAFANVAGLIGRRIAPQHTASLHFYADKKAAKIDWHFGPGTMIPSRPVRRKTGQPSLDLGSFSA